MAISWFLFKELVGFSMLCHSRASTEVMWHSQRPESHGKQVETVQETETEVQHLYRTPLLQENATAALLKQVLCRPSCPRFDFQLIST
jgi:hypothetical protein